MKYPRVMLSKGGNHIEVVNKRSEFIFLRVWDWLDLGPL